MPRTTIRIDGPIFQELKALQAEERKTLGELVSELLAEAMSRREKREADAAPPFSWISRPMGARIDLDDKEALYEALDGE